MLGHGKMLVVPVERLGSLGIGVAYAFSMMAVLAMALYVSPGAALLVPAVPLFIAAAVYVLRRPLLCLALLLSSVVFVITQQDGLGAGDIFFAAFFLVFVVVWFLPRLLRGHRLAYKSEDTALLVFLILVPVSLLLTMVWNGKLTEAIPQLFTISFLALYFPIRDVCREYRHGTAVMLAVLLGVVGYAALRNLINYQLIVSSAEHVWQYTRARVYVNDSLMMAGSVVSLVITVLATRRSHILLFAALHVCCLAALIMTQSRAFWVAFIVGAAFTFVLINRKQRLRFTGLILVVGISGTVISVVFLSDFLPLIIAGLTERLGSLSTATTDDLSLVNRFVESQAVWDRIKVNPIIGYGLGVPFSYHDITWNATMTGTFMHSGYLSLWYRFGLWGLIIILYMWGRAAWSGVVAFKRDTARPVLRAAGPASAAVLVAYILPAQTSNPFVLIDSIFLFTITMGIASGARSRVEVEAIESADENQYA
jgi:O-antigen ligase